MKIYDDSIILLILSLIGIFIGIYNLTVNTKKVKARKCDEKQKNRLVLFVYFGGFTGLFLGFFALIIFLVFGIEY